MEQSPACEANRFSASQKIPNFNIIIKVSIINKINIIFI
jgi:hypothetical protein